MPNDAHISQPLPARLNFSLLHLLVDAGCLLLAFLAAYTLRFHSALAVPLGSVPLVNYYVFYIISLPFWLVIFGYYGLYFACLRESAFSEMSRIPAAIGLSCIASITLSFLVRGLPSSRLTFLFIFIIALVLIILARWALRILTANRTAPVVLMLGGGPVAEVLESRIGRIFGKRATFIRMAGDEVTRRFFGSRETPQHFLDYIAANGVTDVVCLLTPTPGLWQSLFILGYEGRVRVRQIPAGEGLLLGSVKFSPEFGFPQITPKSRHELAAIRSVKRAADVVTAGAALIILSPLFGIAALMAWLSSPGPVFFRHERLGADGKTFMLLKFRTMRCGVKLTPEQEDEFKRTMKLKNDPRITKAGSILRKTSLDELPQLVNILRGEMSLVGPRPIVPEELAKYGDWGRILQSFPPGLTGLWQVSGRSDLTYRERIDLDIYYITNWSPALDFSIIIRTPGALLSRKGAY